MQVMGELSEVYNLDREKALTIGILHDAAKDLPLDQQKQFIEEGRVQIFHECEKDYVYYLHAPVGAYLIQQELGITDGLILDAITTHTFYGNSQYFNDPHSWCMRFSDLLEPNRNWSSEKLLSKCTERLRKIVYSGNMAEGAYLQTGTIIEWYKEKEVPVHPNMFLVKKELSVQLGHEDLLMNFLFEE